MRKDHVVFVDVKHCGTRPHFWTSVVFASTNEFDALLKALTLLRDQADNPEAHCHLQHYGLNKDGCIDEGEIMFHSPAFRLSAGASEREDFALEARKLLGQ
jgi:hypothetical protein